MRGAGSGASNPGVYVTQGDYYVLRHQIYSFNAFSFNNVTAPTLSDVTIWSIPGMVRVRTLTLTISIHVHLPLEHNMQLAELYQEETFRIHFLACTQGFYFGKSTDITIRNSSVRARPGRPMSITADASHVEEASGSVHLDGVHFEQQGDDGLQGMRDRRRSRTVLRGMRPEQGRLLRQRMQPGHVQADGQGRLRRVRARALLQHQRGR